MCDFFDYNGDGVANEQDEIDYWDDDYYERTHHIGMYAETNTNSIFDNILDDEDNLDSDIFGDIFESDDY